MMEDLEDKDLVKHLVRDGNAGVMMWKHPTGGGKAKKCKLRLRGTRKNGLLFYKSRKFVRLPEVVSVFRGARDFPTPLTADMDEECCWGMQTRTRTLFFRSQSRDDCEVWTRGMSLALRVDFLLRFTNASDQQQQPGSVAGEALQTPSVGSKISSIRRRLSLSIGAQRTRTRSKSDSRSQSSGGLPSVVKASARQAGREVDEYRVPSSMEQLLEHLCQNGTISEQELAKQSQERAEEKKYHTRRAAAAEITSPMVGTVAQRRRKARTTCKVCGEVFATRYDLSAHAASHPRSTLAPPTLSRASTLSSAARTSLSHTNDTSPEPSMSSRMMAPFTLSPHPQKSPQPSLSLHSRDDDPDDEPPPKFDPDRSDHEEEEEEEEEEEAEAIHDLACSPPLSIPMEVVAEGDEAASPKSPTPREAGHVDEAPVYIIPSSVSHSDSEYDQEPQEHKHQEFHDQDGLPQGEHGAQVHVEEEPQPGSPEHQALEEVVPSRSPSPSAMSHSYTHSHSHSNAGIPSSSHADTEGGRASVSIPDTVAVETEPIVTFTAATTVQRPSPPFKKQISLDDV